MVFYPCAIEITPARSPCFRLFDAISMTTKRWISSATVLQLVCTSLYISSSLYFIDVLCLHFYSLFNFFTTFLLQETFLLLAPNIVAQYGFRVSRNANLLEISTTTIHFVNRLLDFAPLLISVYFSLNSVFIFCSSFN